MLLRHFQGSAYRCVNHCTRDVFNHQKAMRTMGSIELRWHASASLTSSTRGLASCSGQRQWGVSRSHPRARATPDRSQNQHSRLHAAAAVEERVRSLCGPSSHLGGKAHAADELGRWQDDPCSAKLQLRPGEVHVWWLFPEDVRDSAHACATL